MTTDRNHSSMYSRRGALTAAPCVIAAVALYNWVVSPHVGYLHAMQRLEPVMSRMVEELEIVNETLEEKHATMRTLQAELATLQEGLFTREQSQAFVHELQSLVGRAGCMLSAADFTCDQDIAAGEDPNTPPALEAVHADFTVEGQYDQIVAFLQMLRERPQKVWVDSCRIDLVDSGRGLLECQIALTIYVAVQPGELRP